ncbi:MAG: nucleotide sugar dehydrogenase [Chloroflexi bacterium]|nr:nucleotide sugar dehydrogenase [Chloroflexota bacterium]
MDELLRSRLRERTARVAVLGLGFAGLPMAAAFAGAGFAVLGLDIDPQRVAAVNAGRSPVTDVSDEALGALIDRGRLLASRDFEQLASADAVLISVPTPLLAGRQPDLRSLDAATEDVARRLHRGMLVVVQSTCAGGVTRGRLLPVMERSELRVGRDFFLAFAPERIDPGNQQFTVQNTPRLVGGVTPACTDLAAELLRAVVGDVRPVSSPEVAELAKLVENTFRFINISFVNELATLCDRMGLSVWEVVQASATKPFAFMPHQPGPGIGGHCIPISPFHLAATAEALGLQTRLVQAAGRVNAEMPAFVVAKLERLLAERGRRLRGARVAVLGAAYKPETTDVRESPAVDVLALLHRAGAEVVYHDPYVPQVSYDGRVATSVPLGEALAGCAAAVVITPHRSVDYGYVVRTAPLVFDTRNALAAYAAPNVVAL